MDVKCQVFKIVCKIILGYKKIICFLFKEDFFLKKPGKNIETDYGKKY